MVFSTTQAKSIFTSVTFWGSVLTALAISFPATSAKFGMTSSNTAVDAQWIVGAIGTIVTIYGRFRASQPVTLTGASKTP